jgi:hypothetical protein
VDFSSFEEPFTKFIDDQLFFPLDVRVSKRANFYIQRSQSNFQDDIWLGRRDKRSYPQVQNIKTYDDDYSDESGHVSTVYVRLDKQYD